ncbi:MAG TPA: hypothetical protein VFJ16_25870 [Longimicrobium sp.]|nr:hypothetical protein [Longimicrobium sp.]
MNPAHLHLMVNHVPVFGTIFAALLIGWGLLRKSEDVLRLGLILAVLIGIATWGVQLTGEPAEHALAGTQGFQRRLVHAHEEAAELSTYVISLSAVLALVTLVLMRRRRGAARGLAVVTLIAAFAGFGLVSRAALLGGEISHPEARAGWVQPPPPPRPAGRPGGEEGERD